MTGTKLSTWGGANKARVRLFKKHDIDKFLKGDFDKYDLPYTWVPKMLSFAGTRAVLERMLVGHGYLDSEDITTIQTYEKLSEGHHGEHVLKKLMKVRRKHLSKMRIWPYNFHSFSERYQLSGCDTPSSSIQAKWAKKPYKYLMDQITQRPVERFAIVDLDLCGIFSEKNATSITNLFKNRVVDPAGVAFITHQKGRDVRGGKLFDVLHGYLKNCRYIDFQSIPNIDNPDMATYVARYVLVPLYYMCKAYDYGYILDMTRLIEYRDLNEGSGLAVNMLQYFFNWEDADYNDSADNTFRLALEKVMVEGYQYVTLGID